MHLRPEEQRGRVSWRFLSFFLFFPLIYPRLVKIPVGTDLCPVVPIITLNVNGLSMPIKR